MIYLNPNLPKCCLSFPDLWQHLQTSMMVYFPLKYVCLYPSFILWILLLAYGLLLLLTMISVLTRTLVLMHYPHNLLSMLMWLWCITTTYRTPTTYLLASSKSQIGTATIWLSTCVPHGVHWPLIQINFAVHCNWIAPWTMLPTSTL